MGRFTRQLYWFGALGAICYAARTVLSYVLPFPRRGAVFGVLLLAGTVGPLLLLLSRGIRPFDARDARIAFGFAVLFGLLCLPAVPAGTDLWYYIAEGRLAASGANVYVDRLTPAIKEGLPMDPDKVNITMPYGPVWVWLSTALSTLAGPRIAAEFVLYKSLMLAAWLAALWAIRGGPGASPDQRTRALLAFGWLPFAVIMSVAEAHNDIVMAALLAVWLASRHPAGVWSLLASALVKFVTVPIVAVAAVDALVRRSSKAFLHLAVAAIAAAVVLALYWNDGGLLGAMRTIAAQRHLTPALLIAGGISWAGLPAWIGGGLILAWRLLLMGLVVWYGWRHVRQPTAASLSAWSAAVMLAVLLGADRLWPWYALWMLPAVIISGDAVLLALALPIVVLLPLVQVLYLWVYLSVPKATVLLFTVLGLTWLVAVPRSARAS
jgi:alpha-1,6-mannosyltransferase